MTTERTEASWHSSAELLVLHGVRLAGFATVKAVAERAELPANVVDNQLGCSKAGLVEHMAGMPVAGSLPVRAKSGDTNCCVVNGSHPVEGPALDDFENTQHAILSGITAGNRSLPLNKKPEHCSLARADRTR